MIAHYSTAQHITSHHSTAYDMTAQQTNTEQHIVSHTTHQSRAQHITHENELAHRIIYTCFCLFVCLFDNDNNSIVQLETNNDMHIQHMQQCGDAELATGIYIIWSSSSSHRIPFVVSSPLCWSAVTSVSVSSTPITLSSSEWKNQLSEAAVTQHSYIHGWWRRRKLVCVA